MRKLSGFIWAAVIILVVMLFVMFVPNEDGEYTWNPFDYARITELDYKAVVVDEFGSDGKVVITERITFDIHAMSQDNLFWELWRDLPEERVDGVKVTYKVNSVKQVFENKPDVIFTESPRLYWEDYDYVKSNKTLGPGKWFHSKGPYNEDRRLYECVFFYVDSLYRDTVVFEIEYEMYNASLRYADVSELYLSLYDDSSIKYLKSLKGQILIPNEKMPSKGNYDAFTYGTNSHSFDFKESATVNPGYHTFSFSLGEEELKFKPYNQWIEFGLVSYGEDSHKFTEYASKNVYYSANRLRKIRQEQADYEALPEQFAGIKLGVLVALSLGALLSIGLAFLTITKIKRENNFYRPELQMEYFRDIPSEQDPIFASELVFCKHKSSADINDGYASVMLSLVQKEYIELEKINALRDWVSENVKIVVKYVPPPPLDLQSVPIVYCSSCGTPIVSRHEYCPNCDEIIDYDLLVQQKREQQEVVTEEPVKEMKPLTETEERYFNLILKYSKGEEISLTLLQRKVSEDYVYINAFVRYIKNAIINIGVSQGYFQKSEYKKPKGKMEKKAKKFTILGILFAVVGNIISYHTRLDLAFGGFFILGAGLIIGAGYLKKRANKYVLLTQFGEDEYAKWRGLYNFLNSETLMNERTVIELELWEHYLIYATAFGISEKVIKALEIHCPYADTSPVLRNHYFRTRGFRMHSHSFRGAIRTASHGSHGGFGGGGRGGGGGGGGH